MMKFIYIILFIAFTNHSIKANNLWEMTFIIESNPIALECPDDKHVFIIATIGRFCNFYKSDDNGSSWKFANNIDHDTVEDMSCPDSTNIFITFFDGSIYKSNDGGENFESLKLEGIDYIRNIAMYNKNIGVASGGYYITSDGWKTYYNFYEQLLNENKNMSYTLLYPIFKNDSILFSIARIFDKSNPNISGFTNHSLLKLNIKSIEYEFLYIGHLSGIRDFYIIDDNTMFVCGSSNTISGGSTNDAIYKSNDGGKTWRRVLDLYSDKTKFNGHVIQPFGLQSIAFKDSLTGIAVGQFGKILYTHDGGESWTYESKLHDSLSKTTPPTMFVRYSDTIPVVATFTRHIYRMIEDNLAPGLEHKYSISGRVWEGNKGQSGIPVALNTYRITMTDKNGYYRFTNLALGTYTVKALNKYFDDANPLYYYKPYEYKPRQYEFELTNDTTGIDFNAEDIRNYYSLYGTVKNEGGEGIPDIEIQMNSHIYNVILHKTTTDPNGNYKFENLEERGRYTISPLTKGYDFSPAYYETPLTSNLNGMDFVMVPTSVVEETEKPESLSFFISIDKLYINTDLNTNNLSIKIYDLLGMQWLHTDLQAENNIDFLPNGVFFAVIYNKGELLKRFKIYVNK